MVTPTHLKHTPIISVDDYDEIDGKYAGKDAKALSIGVSQYDNDDVSLKVFRKTDSRWSRQSEELPLHRVLDLSILLLRSIAPDSESLAQSPLSEKMSDSQNKLKTRDSILQFCKANRKYLLPRMEELRYLLETVDYKAVL